MRRSGLLFGALAALLSTSLSASLAPQASIDLRDLDEGWLHQVKPAYESLPGFLDVAYTNQPFLHVAILFRDVVPADLPSLHPSLETRGYVLEAKPLTHEPIVPVMHLLAQDLPPGIRPGAWMLGPHACTMAFVVQDQNGEKYITTAGHCVDFVGQTVSVTNHGNIGVVMDFLNDGVGADYAIVKINDNKLGELNPRTAGWGGPTTVATSAGLTTGIKHYGWGALTWQTHETRCRQGVGPLVWGTEYFGFAGVAIWGDSGSEVEAADGRAVGILTHLSLFPWEGTALGTRFSFALSEMGSHLGKTLTLVPGGAVEAQCSHT